jgi:uncharacterized membrane protein/thiol-disulfide isomerase/thioredoxin
MALVTAKQAHGAGRTRAIVVAAIVACLALAVVALPPALAAPSPSAASGSEPVARAVFFYSPDCQHCRELIREDLPPILERYGDRLEILAVDAADPDGAELFLAAVTAFDVPAGKRGVPAVVIGDRFLAGTTDVAEQLPMLAAQYLAAGGVGWPAVPGLPAMMSAADSLVTSSPSQLLAVTQEGDGILDRLARDRWGNTLALILLAGMIAALGLVVMRSIRASREGQAWWSVTATPPARPHGRRLYAGVLLISAGLGIAGYLSYAVMTGTNLLCGPLTACDAVQQSDHARLFGVLPVAYVGLAGYLLIAAAFGLSAVASGVVAEAAARALVALTLCGTLFSIYLTTLEPFVIGATCIWCLGSAAIMTLLLLLSADVTGLSGEQIADNATQTVSGSA